jgi:hypothetical protein
MSRARKKMGFKQISQVGPQFFTYSSIQAEPQGSSPHLKFNNWCYSLRMGLPHTGRQALQLHIAIMQEVTLDDIRWDNAKLSLTAAQ